MRLSDKLLLLFLVIGFTGCVSFNSHQTGRTVGKDNYSLFGNFNFGTIDSEHYSFTSEDTGRFYIAEIGAFRGLKENLDIGIKVNSTLHFTGICKYQFIGDKNSLSASSLGLDVGAAPFGLMMGVMSYSGTLSLFNSIHPTDNFAISFSPRYNYLGFTNFLKEYGYTKSNHIYGYSAAVIYGKKHQFSLELSQYVNNKKFTFDNRPIMSLGYMWNLGK